MFPSFTASRTAIGHQRTAILTEFPDATCRSDLLNLDTLISQRAQVPLGFGNRWTVKRLIHALSSWEPRRRKTIEAAHWRKISYSSILLCDQRHDNSGDAAYDFGVVRVTHGPYLPA